jgi:hypothetical protein
MPALSLLQVMDVIAHLLRRRCDDIFSDETIGIFLGDGRVSLEDIDMQLLQECMPWGNWSSAYGCVIKPE